jgi:hypothetical protein
MAAEALIDDPMQRLTQDKGVVIHFAVSYSCQPPPSDR